MTERHGITPGLEWATADSAEPDATVEGSDAALAQAVDQARRNAEAPLLAWRPDPASQLARALGLVAGAPRTGRVLTLDAIEVTIPARTDALLVVNVAVFGTAPDRVRRWHRGVTDSDGIQAWGVVVANGQFLRDHDIVPRGHPGDGRFEVQYYGIAPSQRGALRRRLGSGTHLPHPAIRQRTVTNVVVESKRSVALSADGTALGSVRSFEARIVPGAYRLAV